MFQTLPTHILVLPPRCIWTLQGFAHCISIHPIQSKRKQSGALGPSHPVHANVRQVTQSVQVNIAYFQPLGYLYVRNNHSDLHCKCGVPSKFVQRPVHRIQRALYRGHPAFLLSGPPTDKDDGAFLWPFSLGQSREADSLVEIRIQTVGLPGIW